MTYYETLGVKRTATIDEIKRAYRTTAKKWHPDLNKSPSARKKFLEIQEAYEVLSDPVRKENYDQILRMEESDSSSRDRVTWNDIEEEILRRTFSSQRKSSPPDPFSRWDAGRSDDNRRNYYFDKDFGQLVTKEFLASVSPFRILNIPEGLTPFFEKWVREANPSETVDRYIDRTGDAPEVLKDYFRLARGSETIEEFMERWIPVASRKPSPDKKDDRNEWSQKTGSDIDDETRNYLDYWMSVRKSSMLQTFLGIFLSLQVVWIINGLDRPDVPHAFAGALMYSGGFLLAGLVRGMVFRSIPGNKWAFMAFVIAFLLVRDMVLLKPYPLIVFQKALLESIALTIYGLVVFENNRVAKIAGGLREEHSA